MTVTITEGKPPWRFVCPECGDEALSTSVVICLNGHDAAEMRRHWITVQSAMTGHKRHIEVLT